LSNTIALSSLSVIGSWAPVICVVIIAVLMLGIILFATEGRGLMKEKEVKKTKKEDDGYMYIFVGLILAVILIGFGFWAGSKTTKDIISTNDCDMNNICKCITQTKDAVFSQGNCYYQETPNPANYVANDKVYEYKQEIISQPYLDALM
jgi:hypothetical protein